MTALIKLLVRGIQRPPQTLQFTLIVLDGQPELDGKTLLLKTSDTFVLGNKKASWF